MRIKGNVVGFPNPQTDWEQQNEILADYLKNKPDDLASQGPEVTSVSGACEGNTVTLRFALEGGGEDVLVLTSDANGVPTNLNVNGVDKSIVLEGF